MPSAVDGTSEERISRGEVAREVNITFLLQGASEPCPMLWVQSKDEMVDNDLGNVPM